MKTFKELINDIKLDILHYLLSDLCELDIDCGCETCRMHIDTNGDESAPYCHVYYVYEQAIKRWFPKDYKKLEEEL